VVQGPREDQMISARDRGRQPLARSGSERSWVPFRMAVSRGPEGTRRWRRCASAPSPLPRLADPEGDGSASEKLSPRRRRPSSSFTAYDALRSALSSPRRRLPAKVTRARSPGDSATSSRNWRNRAQRHRARRSSAAGIDPRREAHPGARGIRTARRCISPHCRHRGLESSGNY